jgi:hypothetical protein
MVVRHFFFYVNQPLATSAWRRVHAYGSHH